MFYNSDFLTSRKSRNSEFTSCLFSLNCNLYLTIQTIFLELWVFIFFKWWLISLTKEFACIPNCIFWSRNVLVAYIHEINILFTKCISCPRQTLSSRKKTLFTIALHDGHQLIVHTVAVKYCIKKSSFVNQSPVYGLNGYIFQVIAYVAQYENTWGVNQMSVILYVCHQTLCERIFSMQWTQFQWQHWFAYQCNASCSLVLHH